MRAYSIPTGQIEFTEEIKKSRFITYIAPAVNVDAAKQFVMTIKRLHPAARHHCWGFIAGSPNDSQALGFSDDGEPSGTAGRPILAQLMGSGLGEVVAVVVRYYGGILLGTGGLVKAYGNGVQQGLQRVKTKLKIPCLEYSLNCGYHQLTQVEAIIVHAGGEINRADYADKVDLTLRIPICEVDNISQKLRDISKGSLLLLLIQ